MRNVRLTAMIQEFCHVLDRRKMDSLLRLPAFGLLCVVALVPPDSAPNDVFFGLFHESHSAVRCMRIER